MQSNTTGLSMETFFEIIWIILLLYMCGQNYSMSKNIKILEIEAEIFRRKFITTLDVHGEDFDRLEKQIDSVLNLVKNDNDRSLLAMREILEPTKPMKSNNWDSVREAFKGPARIDVNERN